jgi:Flp pilus assembly protein TadD
LYPDYGERVALTKAPDPLDDASYFSDELKAMKKAFDEKNESALVPAAAEVLGKDSKNLLALNLLAVHYFNKGEIGLAKILINRALVDHQDEPALYNNLGVIYLAENRMRLAIGSFRRALELKKSYSYAAANLGAIFLEYKDYKKAAPALENAYEALRSDLQRGSKITKGIAQNYAIALGATGSADDAKSIYKDLMKIDDQNVSVVLNYAILLVEKLKDKDEGQKMVARLKFIADDGLTQKRIAELESDLSSLEK